MLKILPLLRRTLDRLFYLGRVLRMNTLENELQGRCRRSVVLEDSIGFVRPDDLAGGNSPAKTSGVTEPLRLRQVRRLALLRALTGD